MWCWRIIKNEAVINEELLGTVNEKRSITTTVFERKSNWIGNVINCLMHAIIERHMDGAPGHHGRGRIQLLDDLKGERKKS